MTDEETMTKWYEDHRDKTRQLVRDIKAIGRGATIESIDRDLNEVVELAGQVLMNLDDLESFVENETFVERHVDDDVGEGSE